MPLLDYEKIARYYDSYVLVAFDIKLFLEETKNVFGKVLELMSGTGRVYISLIEAGVNLTCVDSSVEMLNVFKNKLKEKNLTVNIIETDVCDMSLGEKYDLIFIPFQAFAELVSVSQQHSALEKIYEHLTNDDSFICTLHNPHVRLKSADGNIRLIGKFPIKNEDNILFLWCLEDYDKDGQFCS